MFNVPSAKATKKVFNDALAKITIDKIMIKKRNDFI